MFLNKKINYIFASLGDEKNSSGKNQKRSFFFKKIKKKEILQKKKTNVFELSDTLIGEVLKFTDKKSFNFYLSLENTHDQFISDIQASDADVFYVFPLYPQYHPNLNLIANFFSLNLYDEITNRFFWVKSFHNSPFFIKSIQRGINLLFKKENLNEKETIFLFLADEYKNCFLYNLECEITCQNIIKTRQFADGKLCFFNENNPPLLNLTASSRKTVIIIPISTLIDDITTQKNMETVKSFLEKQNKAVFICKTLNHNPNFIRSILDIIDEKSFVSNKMLTSF